MGRLLLKRKEEITIEINSKLCREKLRTFLWAKRRTLDANNLWLQQGRTIYHTAQNVINLFRNCVSKPVENQKTGPRGCAGPVFWFWIFSCEAT